MSDDLIDMLKHVFTGTEVEVYAITEEGLAPLVRREPATVDNWQLVHSGSGTPVIVGEVLRYDPDDDETLIYEGGRPPHKVSSTGRVYVRHPDAERWETREFFPSVFNLEWRYTKNES